MDYNKQDLQQFWKDDNMWQNGKRLVISIATTFWQCFKKSLFQILGLLINSLQWNSKLLTTLGKKPFENMKKGENAGTQHFCLFPTMFSIHPRTNINFSAKFDFLSANAFNLDQSKNLSFRKELKLYSIDTHFDTSTTDSFCKHCGKRRNCS